MAKAQFIDAGAEVLDRETLNDPMLESQTSVESYVLWKTQEWSDFIEANYYSQWDEYYRLWRGLWASEDRTRETERSRIVTPALQQAVESSVAEIEEATFVQGSLFDIRDDTVDQDPMDVAFMRQKLDEDFQKQKIRQAVSEVLINAAVYGTGAAEIILEEVKEQAPATEPIMDGQLQAVGVNITDRTVVKMKPIQAKNLLIDPVATSIETAHGVATDEFVPSHVVRELQEKGVYRDVHVGSAAQDQDIEPNPELDVVPYEDKVRLLKYYGLVPRHLLKMANGEGDEDEEVADLLLEDTKDTSGESYWVEAIVVIANGGVVLKAEENPYMMQDRPIVAFQWDIVPGLFWGRGVCEKGFNSQKALDAEIRARIDALALTIHPMLAMDATRIPRGHTPQVRPGKTLLTNGKPSDVIQQFSFGNVDQITFAQAGELQKMVQQATGAVDASGLPGVVNGDATASGISMSLGAIIKRQKRTLVNFQDCFWVPFIEKAAWRYMQFDPEHYPVSDYNFIPASSLGIMAREYEVTQLVQLLQTTSDQSPMYGALVEAIVESMNINNREELVKVLRDASKPSPEQQAKEKQAMQMEQEMHQLQMQLQQAQIQAVQAQAAESNARAQKYAVEAQLEPRKLEIDKIGAVADIESEVTASEFDRRLKIADTKLKEKRLNLDEKQLRVNQSNKVI